MLKSHLHLLLLIITLHFTLVFSQLQTEPFNATIPPKGIVIKQYPPGAEKYGFEIECTQSTCTVLLLTQEQYKRGTETGHYSGRVRKEKISRETAYYNPTQDDANQQFYLMIFNDSPTKDAIVNGMLTVEFDPKNMLRKCF